MSKPFTSPTGRLVWGDPFKADKVMDDKTKLPKRDAAGQEIWEFAIGVAFAKNDPLWPAFRALLKAEDRAAWPQFHDAAGEILPGVKFADKITDGDGFNTKGQPRARGENGYAGHWVVKFASRFAPGVNYWDGRQWVQTTDPAALKCGDYIQVNGTTATNKSDQSPGMHRNVSLVAIMYAGQPIMKGADPNEAFGAPPPGQGMAPPMAPAAPPPNAPPPAAHAPPPPPAAVPPPAPAMSAPIMLAGATATYEAYKANGWTDEQLIAQGLMQAPVPVTPSTSYMAPPPAAPPPAPAAPPPMPAPAPPPGAVDMQSRMLPNAPGTYVAMKAANWTDELLIQHGYMTTH